MTKEEMQDRPCCKEFAIQKIDLSVLAETKGHPVLYVSEGRAKRWDKDKTMRSTTPNYCDGM